MKLLVAILIIFAAVIYAQESETSEDCESEPPGAGSDATEAPGSQSGDSEDSAIDSEQSPEQPPAK